MSGLKLRTDQVARVVHFDQQRKTLDLSEPGTGKTPAVATYQACRLEDRGLRSVWVSPKSLMRKNQKELMDWTGLPAAIVDGTKAQIDHAMWSDAPVLIMGPDRFRRMWHQLPASYGALDVDEIHMCFGGASSQRTQEFLAAQEHFKEGVFMTGTLINGRLDTAWPAIHAIEPRYYPFGHDQFIAEHALVDERLKPFAWVNHDRLRRIIGNHGIRFTFEQIFGKQEVVPQLQWVAMDPRQRELYDTFERDALLELEHFMIEGTLPGVATIRARQIMEHPNRFRDLRDPYNLPPVDIMPGTRPEKLDALAIHFDDHLRLEKPLIVFAALVPQLHEIYELALECGLRPAPVICGETPLKIRNEADVGFTAGRYNVIVASHATASVGYNWQFCGEREVDHVINVSLGYMDSDFEQGFRRAIRRKRSTPLRVTTMAYIDSIDIRLMYILETKSRDANKVDPTREVIKFAA